MHIAKKKSSYEDIWADRFPLWQVSNLSLQLSLPEMQNNVCEDLASFMLNSVALAHVVCSWFKIRALGSATLLKQLHFYWKQAEQIFLPSSSHMW